MGSVPHVDSPIARPSVVYIVDDDEAVRDSLGLLLEAHGMMTESFESAAQFLASYRRGKNGCLVLDVQMPGMSGIEMLERLRPRGFDVPVVMISGHADPMAVARALDAGARTVISKPFRDQELLTAIEEALASRGA